MTNPRSHRAQSLMIAASITALSAALPGAFGVYGGRARAQALPAGCTDGGNDIAENGETVTCVSTDPIGEVAIVADDITVNVGSATTATTINEAAGNGITITGGGATVVNVYNENSSVTGSDEGIDVSATGSITIDAEGAVTGSGGIFANNLNGGTGAVTITAVDVTGNGTGANADGINAQNSATGTDLAITATGTVTGGDDGVYAYNLGTGTTTVNVADVTGTNGDGIGVGNGSGSGSMSVTATGAVTGDDNGIFAYHNGSGALTVTAVDATGTNADGIDARVINGTDLTVTATGDVEGGDDGISAAHQGTGAITITAVNVTGDTGYGISAVNNNSGTSISITATGAVSGAYGIDASNSGSGALSITAKDVTGTSGNAIFAANSASGTDLSVTTTGDVLGAIDGIFASQNGSGAATISVKNVTGTSGRGIDARLNAGTDLSLTATGAVAGATDGIFASHQGTGALTISAVDITGTSGAGISASNSSTGTDISITSTGDVLGGVLGISATQNGTGDLTINAKNVTGTSNTGIVASNTATGTDLSITATGDVLGGANGIFATQNGTGAFSINAKNVTGTSGRGIFADVRNGTGLSLTATGAVVGGGDGVFAQSTSPDITINVADVTGTTGHGINAVAPTLFNFVDISVTATGDVIGATRGIEVRTFGGGDVTVNAADVTGTTGDGIRATNRSGGTGLSGTDFSVTSTGDVIGGANGIFVENYGRGGITVNAVNVTATLGRGIHARLLPITAGTGISITSTGAVSGHIGIYGYSRSAGAVTANVHDVTGTGGDAIFLANSANGTSISVTATGTVTGDNVGIQAHNSGSGAVTINAVDVTAANNDGILATNTTAGTDVSITATGTVTGQQDGIQVQTGGSGAVTINAVDVTGESNHGILVGNGTTATDITITATGAVAGGEDGIEARNNGTGALTVNVDSVTGAGGAGLFLNNSSRGTDISVTATDSITGSAEGINAVNDGTGAVTISVADVTGTSGDGILATNSATGTDLSITATGAVAGGGDGVEATNNGAGATTINTAAVTGTNGSGISARVNNGTGLSITATGAVIGGNLGINAVSYYGGAITINAADVTGSDGDGLYATNIGGTDISITSTGTVTGYNAGIKAYNYGSGAITINAVNATGTTDDGIYAIQTGEGTNLSITATGNVIGGDDGIFADNAGSGALTINAANVTGSGGNGIDASNSLRGTDLTITATGAVTGVNNGVSATNQGSGLLTINVADVTGTNYDGIRASSITNGSGLAVTATGTVAGGTDGIDVINDVSGDLTVTAVDVTGGNGVGISAVNGAGATNLVVTSTGTVTGSADGIRARNNGSGALTINAANATGTADDGIEAYNSTNGTDLSITATGTVTGADDGIDARNFGSGALSVTAANATGGNNGIFAQNTANGTDLSITSTGTITGANNGINATNNGSGALTINAANATGTAANGILARNSASGTDLSITSTGTVTGAYYGIDAENLGTGALSINVANVTGMNYEGILARNSASGTGVSITSTGTIRGGNYYGISADNKGSGELTINVANVTSEGADGIYARSTGTTGTGVSLTSTGTVTGFNFGIDARNFAGGALTISTVDVIGTNAAGITAYNGPGGTDLSVTSTGTITGADTGIGARNLGSGALTINAANVTVAAGDAISAVNSSSGTDLSVTVTGGTVTGADDGVDALNNGAGATTVAITGAVTGQAGYGVKAVSNNGSSITVGNGGSVTGVLGAIVTDSRVAAGDPVNDTMTLETGGSVTGDIRLLAGADTFNDRGGSFTHIFGGTGVDTANFDNTGHFVTGVGSNVNSIREFEIFNFNSGISGISGTHTDVMATTIAAGATLNAADATMLSGALANNGILNIGNSPGALTLSGDFVQGSSGVLNVEIDNVGFDQLILDGSATLGGTLNIVFLSGFSYTPGEMQRRIIDAAAGISGAFDTINGENGLLIGQTVEIDAVNSDVNITTTITMASDIAGLTGNQSVVGDALVGLLGDPNTDPELFQSIISLGTISDQTTLATTLNELTPEGLDMGLRYLTTAQDRFLDLAVAQSSVPGAQADPVRVASLEGGPISGITRPISKLTKDASALAEGIHVWGALEAFRLSQNGGVYKSYFDGSAVAFSAGVAGMQVGPFTLGFAGGVSKFESEIDGALGDDGDAELYHIAGTAHTEFDVAGFDTRVSSVVAYASGEQELKMRLLDPASGAEILQRGEAGMKSFDWLGRVDVVAATGDNWTVTPHLQAGAAIYSQDAVQIGGTQVTALQVEDLENMRFQLGLGADYTHRVRKNIWLNASATSVQYFDDTGNVFHSRFARAPGAVAFRTVGKEVNRQLEFDASVDYASPWGFLMSAGAFGEVGDISVFGGGLRVSKEF